MLAVRIVGKDRISLDRIADPEPSEGEARVRIRAAALNHRDLWIKIGQYAGIVYPCVPGSDGAGVVDAVGQGVDPLWVGREVMINPGSDWGDNPAAQGPGFKILGLPRQGTLAEAICVPSSRLSSRPEHLSWSESAALPLAGLTACRALFSRAGLKSGERVLITGIGGGVALSALALARGAGAEVWVTSGSDQKIAKATALGASGGFNYATPQWAAEAAARGHRFDVILDGAGGPAFPELADLAAPGGRIVFYGATRGDPPLLPMRKVFWRQISLLGSTMGNDSDWRSLLERVHENRIRPVVAAEFPLARAQEAFDLMQSGGQFGKILVRISD